VKLYDSHCHLDYEELARDLEGVLQRGIDRGVEEILVAGVEPEQWERASQLKGAGLRFAVGLHPQALHAMDAASIDGAIEVMPEWIEHLGARAIGELGWDKPYAQRHGPSLERQSAVAEAQIDLAIALELPVILHVVDAHGLALERLAPYAPLRGVVHSYSGSAELVARYASLGLSISIGPSILREGSRRIREAAMVVLDEHLLIETDSPCQIGEPAQLIEIARAVAYARSTSVESVAELSRANACRLFG
jgi:TatD DNase family protein